VFASSSRCPRTRPQNPYIRRQAKQSPAADPASPQEKGPGGFLSLIDHRQGVRAG
jgi:hypothetical protein